MNFATIIISTFNSIFKLVFVVIAGFLATKTANFNEKIRKGYSTVVFQYFVPATVFAQAATAVSRIYEITHWWYLFVICLIINCINFPTIWILAKVFKLDKYTRRIFVYSVVFGNTMYLPLAMVESITSESNVFGPNAKETGTAYICTFLLLGTLIYWILGYSYVKRNQDDVEQLQRKNENETNDEMKSKMKSEDYPLIENVNKNNKNEVINQTVEIEMMILKDDIENKQENIIEENKNKENVIETQPNKLKQIITTVKSYCEKIPEPIRRIIRNVLAPPSVATLLGILFILMYPVRDFFFGDGGLSIIGRSFKYLGSAAVISALFILGGNLSNGPSGGTIKWYVIAIAVLLRMIIVPCICIALNFVLWFYGVLPSDPMFFFVCCIESCTPPAFNGSIVINIVYPEGNKQASTLMFWFYTTALFTETIFVSIILHLISIKQDYYYYDASSYSI